MSATTLKTPRAVQPDALQTIPSPLSPSDGGNTCHKDVDLAQIAQAARSNAATCLDLAESLFRQGTADALLKLAQECQSIAQRAAAL